MSKFSMSTTFFYTYKAFDKSEEISTEGLNLFYSHFCRPLAGLAYSLNFVQPSYSSEVTLMIWFQREKSSQTISTMWKICIFISQWFFTINVRWKKYVIYPTLQSRELKPCYFLWLSRQNALRNKNWAHLINKRHGSWMLLQMIWLWNRTSHKKVYFKFLAW